MKRLTALILTLALLLSVVCMPAAQAATYATATVKGGWLRLRAEASTNSQTISAYFTGTSVTILGGSGQWYYVSTPDGKTGYMHADYLTITGSITGGQLDENTPAYVTSKNGLPVRMRTGPSQQYSTITSYAVGTPVTILIMGDEWCKVRIGARTGYMMTEFLTATAPDGSTSTTPSTYTAYVTSGNGLGVRLRSGASKFFPTLATYSVGTRVTVLEYGKTWCKISVNGLTGYMMTEFLTTTAPSTVIKAVTIDQSSAGYGDVLSAIVTPSGASVTYEWLNNKGYVVGTAKNYSVQKSDVGTRLRVRVTGINGSTGSAVSGWITVQGDSVGSLGYVLKGISISDTTPTVGQTLYATITPSGATANISWFRDDGVFVGSGSAYTVRSVDTGRRLYAWADGTGVTSGEATSNYTQAVTAKASSDSGTGSGSVSGTRIMGVTLSDTTPLVGQTLYATVSPGTASATITWYRDDDRILGVGSAYTVRPDDVGHTMYVWAEGSGSTFGSATSSITAPVAYPTTSTDLGW